MIRVELIVEVDGKEVYRGPSKSFVRNMGIVLAGMLKNNGDAGTFKSVVVTGLDGGSTYAYVELPAPGNYSAGPLVFNAGDNDDSFGIVVGSGSAPVSPYDYNLASKIPHGTGTGQLDYDTHSTISSYGGSSSYVEISRTFVNKSGSDVVVREVGLVGCSFHSYQDIYYKFMVARDVLPNPVTVKPLASLIVRYRLSLALT